MAIEIYADESCQTGHKYLVIGVFQISKSRSNEIFQRFADLRAVNNYEGEIKWKKLSPQKALHYHRWADAAIDLLNQRRIMFHALVFDTATFDHKTYNQGDGEIGFSKLLYQLLLHRCGKPALGVRPVYGYLDSRTTKHDPENLRLMLNAGLAKRHNIHTQPFRRLTFRESSECDLIQALDLFIGALAWRRNGKGGGDGARTKCKQELADYIAAHVNQKPTKWAVNIWNFEFQPRK